MTDTAAPRTRWAVLPAASSNRVFGGVVAAMTAAELGALNRWALDGRLGEVAVSAFGGVDYVTCSPTAPLDGTDERILAALSSAQAVFELVEPGPLLRPARSGGSLDHFDDDLITIPRYAGRTNEVVTRLLVNLAVAAAGGRDALDGTRRCRIFDPVCGRGTTLNQAVMYGFDADGIEIEARDVEAWATFFTTWCKNKRLPHHLERSTRAGSRSVTVSVWADRAKQRAGHGQRVTVTCGDTLGARRIVGARCVDAIVADLPYGVNHGSRTGGSRQRRPDELLAAVLPAWRETLVPGGAMALAFNTHTLPAQRAHEALRAAGMVPLDPGAPLAHRVDQAIVRDVVVATAP